MKKLKVWLAAVLALAVGVFCLVACGDGDEGDGKIEGTYKLYSTTQNGIEMTIDSGAGKTWFDMMGFEGEGLVLVLNADNSATYTEKGHGQEHTDNGTWAVDANDPNKIIVTFEDNSTETYTRSGNKLTWSVEGTMIPVTCTLKK